MKLMKREIQVIYIAMRILEGILPYEDEVGEILDKCRTILDSDNTNRLDDEILRIIRETELLKPLEDTFI